MNNLIGRTSQEFLDDYVLENLEDFRNNQASSRLAFNLAVSCLALCDLVSLEFSVALPAHIPSKARAYENHLRDLHDEMALVFDVANSFKHQKISRNDRRLTNASQTASDGFRCGDSVGMALNSIVVIKDDQVRVPMLPVFERVAQLWKVEVRNLNAALKEGGHQRRQSLSKLENLLTCPPGGSNHSE